MDCSTPGFPVLHCLLEFAQTQVRWVWCHPTNSFSAAPFFCLPSFPASGSFLLNGLFTSGGQNIGAAASISVLPMNIQDWFPLGLTGLILQSKGFSRVFFNIIRKHQFFGAQSSLWSNSHPYATAGKTIALTRWTFVGKMMSLLFNTVFRFFIAFLPVNKCLLISWLQSLSAVILEPKKVKSVTTYTFSPSICHEVMGLDAMTLVFLMLSLKPAASFSFTLIKRLFSSSSLPASRNTHLQSYYLST